VENEARTVSGYHGNALYLWGLGFLKKLEKPHHYGEVWVIVFLLLRSVW
jgi:hypothetical protein